MFGNIQKSAQTKRKGEKKEIVNGILFLRIENEKPINAILAL